MRFNPEYKHHTTIHMTQYYCSIHVNLIMMQWFPASNGWVYHEYVTKVLSINSYISLIKERLIAVPKVQKMVHCTRNCKMSFFCISQSIINPSQKMSSKFWFGYLIFQLSAVIFHILQKLTGDYSRSCCFGLLYSTRNSKVVSPPLSLSLQLFS